MLDHQDYISHTKLVLVTDEFQTIRECIPCDKDNPSTR